MVAYIMPFGPTGGAYAEEVVVPSASVVPAPRGASFAQASTLLLNAVIAQLALDALAVPTGSTFAVLGAAGAVGGYLLELAKHEGLRVIGTASAGDGDLLRSLGADTTLDRDQDMAACIREIVPGGVMALADCAALDAAALALIADGGVLAAFKGWSGPTERGIGIHPISSFTAAQDTALLDRLARQAEEGVLSLRVAEVLPAARAAEAHQALADGGLRGRIVLDFSEPL